MTTTAERAADARIRPEAYIATNGEYVYDGFSADQWDAIADESHGWRADEAAENAAALRRMNRDV